MRHLLAFLLLGTLLFVGKRALEIPATDKPELTVRVARSASQREIDAAIDEAVLIERALASRSARTDPVVREQILRAMRLETDAAGDEEAVLTRAFQLGLQRLDPVVRQRLVFQARQVLRASLRPRNPTDSEIEAYLHVHSERYRQPARVSFRQLFLSRARHGGALAADVEALAQRLHKLEPTASGPLLPSDATLLPSSMERVSEREIDARFGPDFGQAVFAAQEGRYRGPIASSYGVHFILIRERSSESLSKLSELRPRVTSDFLHDAEDAALSKALRALRTDYLIRVERSAT